MSPFTSTTLASLGALLLLALGCSNRPVERSHGPTWKSKATAQAAAEPAAAPAPEPAGGSSQAATEAKQTFASRCVVCHGASGAGDGPAAGALNPKPRDYTNPEWQSTVTDEQIKSVIMMGGAAIGKSPIMPASPDLQAKPEVVDELVKIVRGFKRG